MYGSPVKEETKKSTISFISKFGRTRCCGRIGIETLYRLELAFDVS